MISTPVRHFHLVLIKPTHYDDDGYPIQWYRSNIPANTLACLYGLALDSQQRQILGADVDFQIRVIDESNERLQPDRLIREITARGARALIALVGVQSNQFPRAMDIARPFRARNIPVCIGGFHVAGSLAMLKTLPEELVEARTIGISFFAGEAETGRLDEVLLDGWRGKLKPIYNYLDALPALDGATVPILPRRQVQRTWDAYSSFDLGRGCPFVCSFCSIINVQGRTSRFRSADDLEAIVRRNHALGIDRFFITDDNLARNGNWEGFFDRLIRLREDDGIAVRLIAQVDTLCHRIPGFIDKAVQAGVDQIFIGLESVNPQNLLQARKKQNRTGEYRKMLLAWKQHPVVITAGYIIGFPDDTRESIVQDVETIKRELPLDLIYFTYLTPLPGSEDHRSAMLKGIWLDPDLNKYDLNHRVTHHPKMPDAEWEQAYDEAWARFYTFEHMETILRRMVALRSNKRLTTVHRLVGYREFRRQYGVHPLEGGFARRKHRGDRRPGLPRENLVRFHAGRTLNILKAGGAALLTYVRLRWTLHRILRDEQRYEYRDAAIMPLEEPLKSPVPIRSVSGGVT